MDFQIYVFIVKYNPSGYVWNTTSFIWLPGLAVHHTVGLIFEYILDGMRLYLINCNADIVLEGVNCCWFVRITFVFDGSPQIIVQRCQIAAPRRPNDIRISADDAIIEDNAQKIERSVGCVTRGAVLLEPNVFQVFLFKFREQLIGNHGAVVVAIDCNGRSLLIFKKLPNDAARPKSAPKSHSLWMHRLLYDDVRVFRPRNAAVLLIDIPAKMKMRLIRKDDCWFVRFPTNCLCFGNKFPIYPNVAKA